MIKDQPAPGGTTRSEAQPQATGDAGHKLPSSNPLNSSRPKLLTVFSLGHTSQLPAGIMVIPLRCGFREHSFARFDSEEALRGLCVSLRGPPCNQALIMRFLGFSCPLLLGGGVNLHGASFRLQWILLVVILRKSFWSSRPGGCSRAHHTPTRCPGPSWLPDAPLGGCREANSTKLSPG